jgi:hypothetical protein
MQFLQKMKIIQKIVLALLVCTVAVGLSACQSPGVGSQNMVGSPNGYQTTKIQFSLVDNLNAKVYINGGGSSCSGRTSRGCLGGGMGRQGRAPASPYFGNRGYGGWRQPLGWSQGGFNNNSGQSHGKVVVNNRNINNNNNVVRIIRR